MPNEICIYAKEEVSFIHNNIYVPSISHTICWFKYTSYDIYKYVFYNVYIHLHIYHVYICYLNYQPSCCWGFQKNAPQKKTFHLRSRDRGWKYDVRWVPWWRFCTWATRIACIVPRGTLGPKFAWEKDFDVTIHPVGAGLGNGKISLVEWLIVYSVMWGDIRVNGTSP